jgi:hypothetical protein
MTVALEELVLKAKKLPTALDVSKEAVGVLDDLLVRGEIKPLQRFVEGFMLKDSDLIKGMNVSRVDLPAFLGGATSAEIEGVFKEFEKKGFSGMYGITQKGADAYRENKLLIKNDYEMANLSAMDRLPKREGFSRGIWDYQSMQGAIAKGEGNREFRRHVSRTAAKGQGLLQSMDKRLLGPLALGAVGTIALGAVMGEPGYSARPMVMPGEISDHRVNAAIAGGSLGSQASQGPAPSELAPGPHMNAVNRPINTGEAYFTQRNAYQIMGNAATLAGMSSVSNFVAGMGGSSSVRINDTRRPLTPNYIDRLTSE